MIVRYLAAVLFGMGTLPAADTGRLDRFSWLIGSWHIPGTESQYLETWEAVNDSLYTGIGWAMTGMDTVFFESIELRYQAGAIVYTVRARDENGYQSVDFRLVADSADTFVFENPEHDFPQRIVYAHRDADSLNAYIEGTVDGHVRRSDFPMVRKE